MTGNGGDGRELSDGKTPRRVMTYHGQELVAVMVGKRGEAFHPFVPPLLRFRAQPVDAVGCHDIEPALAKAGSTPRGLLGKALCGYAGHHCEIDVALFRGGLGREIVAQVLALQLCVATGRRMAAVSG